MKGSYTGPHAVQLANWIDYAPFEQMLQIEIVEATEGRSVLKMPFLFDFAQGDGLMHGGALVGLHPRTGERSGRYGRERAVAGGDRR